jgi:hypothetical protein
MRGRRRSVASVLADTLTAFPNASLPAAAVAFAEACGPRLAREVSVRGLTRDGRLLVLVRSAQWAAQLTALEATLCTRVNDRLGRTLAHGLDVRLAAEG